jgi:eukaryotic-like serine/threonine-protein kinase
MLDLGPVEQAMCGDRYRIRRELGRGGMGIVYEALDGHRGIDVALKVLQNPDPRSLRRFKREFRALADVAHENLVSLYELEAQDQLWFFTMELLRGVDLDSHVIGHTRPVAPLEAETQTSAASLDGAPRTLATQPTVRPGGEQAAAPQPLLRRAIDAPCIDRLRRCLVGLVRGVTALHDSGHLHRDIKPSNVLVTGEGRVVLLDFGVIAQAAAPAQRRGRLEVVGTPGYMAPEQWQAMPCPASDWYSVGVVLYRVLTGQLPFAPTPSGVQSGGGRSLPPLARQWGAGLPADLVELCESLLHPEAAARPGGRELLRWLGVESTSITAPQVPTINTTPDTLSGEDVFGGRPMTSLIGRGPELARLHALLAETSQGGTRSVLVGGSSGVGKSALVRRFLDDATHMADVVLFEGRCYQRESVPYKAIDSIVDALSVYLESQPPDVISALLPRDAATLAEAFPVLGNIEQIKAGPGGRKPIEDPRELRRRAFAGLRDLFGRMAERHPVVIFIDDAQWGDAESAALWDAIMRPPDPPSVLMLATCRDHREDPGPLVQDLRAAAGRRDDPLALEVLSLAPLNEDQSARLAEAALSNLGLDLASAPVIVREAQGSPFFIAELARYLADAPEAEVAHLKLDAVLGARIGHLAGPAQRLLRILALAAKPVEKRLVVSAAGLEGSDGVAAVEQLRLGHFVRASAGDSDLIEPYHDRMRQAATMGLSADERTLGFAALAGAFESAGSTDFEALIEFHRGAGNRAAAAAYAQRAATAARDTLAFARAAHLLGIALDLGQHASAGRALLLTQRGAVLEAASRGHDAAQAYAAAAELSTGARAIDLHRLAAERYLQSGYIAPGIESLSRALAGVGTRLPARPIEAVLPMLYWRLRLRLRGFRYRLRAGDDLAVEETLRADASGAVASGFGIIVPTRTFAFTPRYLYEALELGEPRRIARAAVLAAKVAANTAQVGSKRAAQLLAVVDELAQATGRSDIDVMARIGRALVGIAEGNQSGAADLCEDAIARARELEQSGQMRPGELAWEVASTMFFSTIVMYSQGEFGRMRALVPGRVRDAEERNDLYTASHLRIAGSAMLHFADGDCGEAQRELSDAVKPWAAAGYTGPLHVALSRQIEVACGAGEGQWARARYCEALPGLRASKLLHARLGRVIWHYWSAMAHLGAVRDGGRDRHELLATVERLARALGKDRRSHPGHEPIVRANLAATCGDAETAIRQLRVGIGYWVEGAGPAPYRLAASYRLGQLLGGTEGAALMAKASEELAAMGVADLAMALRAWTPGFRD